MGVTRSRSVSTRGRARLYTLLLRELVFGPASHARVRVGDAVVEIGDEGDFAVDWRAFVEVLGERPYPGPYDGAAVLDVGAHKGYFGAFALARGASYVVSFEPGRSNFAALSRAAAPFRDRWITRNSALGRTAGTGVLHLDATSWAHSLIEVERPVGSQPVSIVTLAQALAELPTGARRTIVKMDAEGSEWDILQGDSPFSDIDLLMVEWHPAIARCSEDELVQSITARGLDLATSAAGVLRFERRGLLRNAAGTGPRAGR
jgi:FkbM family methyltransferase